MPLFKKNSKVIELNPSDFKGNKIIHKASLNKMGMIAYMANWCGHCQRMSPVFDEVASTMGSSFPLFYIDAEKHASFVSNTLKINSFPTIRYIDNTGSPYKDFNGVRETSSMISDICKESHVCKRR